MKFSYLPIYQLFTIFDVKIISCTLHFGSILPDFDFFFTSLLGVELMVLT